MLTIDFDLDASHTVDLTSTPAIATAEPFIVAELDPVDTKEIRVRGRYIEANEAEMYYVVALRPFYDKVGDFVSGAGSTDTVPPPVAAQCNPADPGTANECGTLIIGLTDGDGDFLSYTVDVMSLILEKADGSLIEVLPNATRVDFSQYVDLTEFISVATVPPGLYVAGTIKLDYSSAEVFVEDGDMAREAMVVDAGGNALQ